MMNPGASSSSGRRDGTSEDIVQASLARMELGPKEGDENGDVEVMLFPDNDVLKAAIECPVCMEVPFGEIINCNGGHSICKYCLEKMPGSEKYRECPLCKTKMFISMYGSSRNYAIEKIISKGTFSCPRDGCNAVRNGEQMPTHLEEECAHRDVCCDICFSQGNRKTYHGYKITNYVDHLAKTHHLLTPELESDRHRLTKAVTFELDDNFRTYRFMNPSILKFDGEDFILQIHIGREIQAYDTTYIWIQIVGGKEKAKKYEARVRLRGLTSMLTWRLPVFDIRTKRPTEAGEVGSLNIHQLQGFSTAFSCGKGFAYSLLDMDILLHKKADPVKQNP